MLIYNIPNSEIKNTPEIVYKTLRVVCNNTFSIPKQTMKSKLLAPFRAIKNKLLDAIIERANITANKVALEIAEEKDFCETTVQIVGDNLLDKSSTLEIIADGMNYGSLAYEVDLRQLAEYIDLNDLSYSVADQFSACEIAENFDASDIADLIHDRMENMDKESIQEELEKLDSNINELKDLMYEEVKLSTEKLKKTSSRVADLLQELGREY
jgi:predicted transcriptional regulator